MSMLDFNNLSNEQRAINKTIALIEFSQQHQALKEAEAIAFSEQKKRDAENEKLAAQHLEETRRAREAEARRLREESNKNLEVELRQRFFRANPNALESDYARVKDRLKEEHFLEQMKGEATAQEIVRNSGNYSRM